MLKNFFTFFPESAILGITSAEWEVERRRIPRDSAASERGKLNNLETSSKDTDFGSIIGFGYGFGFGFWIGFGLELGAEPCRLLMLNWTPGSVKDDN